MSDETTIHKVSGGRSALQIVESTHDTFDAEKRTNWLVNGAGLGIYAHGRVHQDVRGQIYVSDIVHKRGPLMTDDLLSMEEQALPSYGPPLSTNSRMGQLRALEILPTMNTANGEGDLIGYYDNGVVAYNTHEVPRESRYDAEGNPITRGWDFKRLVNHLLNSVSATGRYAVAVLPRDHFFRSRYGLHFLQITLGGGSYNDEATNTISSDVEPLLLADSPRLLSGAACGHWLAGHRMFASTGLVEDASISATPFGRGFVSFNQRTTITEDNSPIPRWEGLWVPDHGVAGVHRFLSAGLRAEDREFGFVSSDRDSTILVGVIDPNLDFDVRGGEQIPIEWSFETGQFHFTGLDKTKIVKDGSLEAFFSSSSQRIRVSIRTDRHAKWEVWKEFSPCVKTKAPKDRLLEVMSFGPPPRACKEGTWFQVLVEGVGPVEFTSLVLDYSESTEKTGRRQCSVVEASERDPFLTNSSPPSTRWS